MRRVSPCREHDRAADERRQVVVAVVRGHGVQRSPLARGWVEAREAAVRLGAKVLLVAVGRSVDDVDLRAVRDDARRAARELGRDGAALAQLVLPRVVDEDVLQLPLAATDAVRALALGPGRAAPWARPRPVPAGDHPHLVVEDHRLHVVDVVGRR